LKKVPNILYLIWRPNNNSNLTTTYLKINRKERILLRVEFEVHQLVWS